MTDFKVPEAVWAEFFDASHNMESTDREALAAALQQYNQELLGEEAVKAATERSRKLDLPDGPGHGFLPNEIRADIQVAIDSVAGGESR